jgi:RND family efflux transporter MFP subunit
MALGLSLVVAGLADSAAVAQDDAADVAVTRAEEVPLVETLSLSGSLSSPDDAELAGEVAGRVRRIAVEAGDRVAAGDTLVVLDAELAELELAQANAMEREAAAELEDARRRLREAQNLAERQSVAASEVEARKAEVRRDEAVLARRRAERRHRVAMVARHTLEAPFDGVISERMVDQGEWVRPEQPMFSLVAVDPLRLELRVPQRHFGRISNDTSVRFRVEALGEETRRTTISEVVPVTQTGTRTFPVRARIDNSDARLAPGMSARATLRLDTGRTGVVVPQDALIRYPDGRVTVWVVAETENGRVARERQVQPGLSFDGKVAIGDAVAPGTRVVVRGNESLRADQPIRITERP